MYADNITHMAMATADTISGTAIPVLYIFSPYVIQATELKTKASRAIIDRFSMKYAIDAKPMATKNRIET